MTPPAGPIAVAVALVEARAADSAALAAFHAELQKRLRWARFLAMVHYARTLRPRRR